MERLALPSRADLGVVAWTPRAVAQTFQTAAEHAILVDADSGTVLFERNADQPFAPASMAKLMTLDVIFNQMRLGRLNEDSEFFISENAWRRGGANAGGSSMFAQLNSRIKLPDLLRGIMVRRRRLVHWRDLDARGRRGFAFDDGKA